MNYSIKHKIITVIHFLEHLFDLLLNAAAPTYKDERVVLVLGRHERLDHLLSDAPCAAYRPVLIWRLHDREVAQLALLFELSQVLVQDYVILRKRGLFLRKS